MRTVTKRTLAIGAAGLAAFMLAYIYTDRKNTSPAPPDEQASAAQANPIAVLPDTVAPLVNVVPPVTATAPASPDAPSVTIAPIHEVAPAPARELKRVTRASELLGKDVKNDQGELLGTVKELAIHLQTGEIGEVLLSSPGYVGTRDTLIAVDPAELRLDAAANVVHIDADMEVMKSKPRFENWQWVPFLSSNRMDEIYRYHGGVAFRDAPRSDQPQWGLWQYTHEFPHVTPADINRRIPSPNWGAYLGYLQRSSDLMGAAVMTPKHEPVGNVEDLVVDLAAGRTVAVIVSTGNFMEMTDELSPLPAQIMVFHRGHDVAPNPGGQLLTFPSSDHEVLNKFLVADVTRGALEKAPHFNAGNWPDFSQREYLEEIYRAHSVEVYPAVTIRAAGSSYNLVTLGQGK